MDLLCSLSAIKQQAANAAKNFKVLAFLLHK